MSTGNEIKVQVEVQVEIPGIAKIFPITTEVNGREITIVHVELKKAITPEEVRKLKEAIARAKRYISTENVVISGRGPIWMYCILCHMFHGIAQCVGVLDPKLEGAVIVMSHVPYTPEGTVIKLPKDLIERILQLSTPG